VSVKDTEGAAVLNYTATSATGANYVSPITAAPRLAVQQLAPNSMQITWSTNFTGYVLESVSTLSQSGWIPIVSNVSTNGSNFAVTIPTADRQRYFRG
jgi:hypothetical protein